MVIVKYSVLYFLVASKTHFEFYLFIHRQLKKLDEDSLTKQPEEVFDVLEKLGEG